MTYGVDRRVDAYIHALPESQQEVCHEIRDLVHAADPDVIETINGSGVPFGVTTSVRSISRKPQAAYRGSPGSVAISDIVVNPAAFAASSDSAMIRRPSPRRPQSGRTNIAR